MEKSHFILASYLLFMSFIFSGQIYSSGPGQSPQHTIRLQNQKLTGAWKLIEKKDAAKKESAGSTSVMILSDGYFTEATYHEADKKFMGTRGGSYALKNGKLMETIEFNTFDSTNVGLSHTLTYQLNGNRLQLSGMRGNKKIDQTWERIEEKNTPLTGIWRIRERETPEGELVTIERGPRKTIKILSGNRFQWIAINTQTKEFFGTGGGTYTAKDGKYKEIIEFFSRDPKRVGMQLSFDFEVKGNDWHHKGVSTSGNKINEVWEKEK